ncbi:Peptidase-S8 domain-containing protein [Fusarium keratoplasticum]|nr:Peptidase-S8 domain-containing protein [Fusarium keratoplasticum]
MSFNNQSSTGGIEHTTEWILIRELRQSSHSFSPPGVVGNTGRTRTLKLRNAINDLELQIRRTFTILRFDLLLHLQNEVKGDAPKAQIYKDSRQDNSDEDTDDASSQSSAEPHVEDWPSHGLCQGFDSIQPSVGEARSRLEQLCKFLETRVNPNLSTPGQRDNRSAKYPRLTQLIETIKQLSSFPTTVDLIPTAGSKPKPFLFNVAEDEATAKAFVAFTDPSQKRPPKEVRNQMTADAKEMAQFFLSFNSFVDALQMSAGSLDVLAWEPTTKRLTSKESFASFSLLRKFQNQTEAACRAVLSHIGLCTHPKHQVLLQLPGWEEVSDWDSTKTTANLPVPLFFTMCFLEKKQALQRMQDDTEKEMSFNLWWNTSCVGGNIDIEERKTLAIKLVLGLMLSLDSDHVFETWDPKQVHLLESVDTYTPFVSLPCNASCPSHQKTLSFSDKYSLGSIDDLDESEPSLQFVLLAKALLQIAEGDHLAGLGVNKDSSTVSWDAWNRFREAIEGYIRRATCGAEVDREVLPFLHAALGCLDFHTEYQSRLMENQSSQKMEAAWQLVFDTILIKIDDKLTLKSIIASTNPSFAQDPTPDPPPFPGHEVVQQAMSNSGNGTLQSSSNTTVAKRAPIRQPSLPSAEPSQPNIQLFDTNLAMGSSTAEEFWACLETFHKSYARFVNDRSTESGDETPRRVRIAVIDTGVDFGHAGIADAKEKGRIREEWCHSWVGADAKDEDDELHGTNCAYLLHKSAPEADIYIEKVFNQNAVRYYEAKNIAKAIEHAVSKWDVDIISMSFGLTRPASRDDGDEVKEQSALETYNNIVHEVEAAIRKAPPRLMFAAASNSGKNKPRAFPARDNPYVICVHASEGNGQDGGINPEIGSGFNFMTLGMGLDLMKRENIVKNRRALARYKRVVKSGTSFATPIAAGIAATVLDLAARVDEIDERVEEKLKRPEGMEKMLRLMSTPKGDVRDRMYYMAPWHHWTPGWEREERRRRWVWDTINLQFD